jgi:2-polyprenyl-6-hydroxyphenyl methylase/3-demethylubiquinone-9 3-methyltransferase
MVDGADAVTSAARTRSRAASATSAALAGSAAIRAAIASLTGPLGLDDLSGRLFCDVAPGTGISSLAGHLLGARVRSLVACAESARATARLRQLYAPGSDWSIEGGSILDEGFVARLGPFDVVHWRAAGPGGNLWQGLRAAAGMVAPDGLLQVAIAGVRERPGCGTTRAPVAAAAVTTVPGATATAEADIPDITARSEVATAAAEAAPPGAVYRFLRGFGLSLCYLRVGADAQGCDDYVFARSRPLGGDGDRPGMR